MLDFEKMFTPKILTSLYIFSSLAAFAVICLLLSAGNIAGAIAMVFVLIFNRVFFELIIVVFKNNEYLKDSRDCLKQIADAIGHDKAFSESLKDDFDLEAEIKKEASRQGRERNERSERNGDEWKNSSFK